MAVQKITLDHIKEVCAKPNDPEDQRLLIRKVSYYIVLPFLYTPITPTQVTLLWLFLGLISALFFYPGSYSLSVLGSVLMMIAFVLDYVDGNIARYKQQFSQRGYLLDLTGSFFVTSALLFTLGFGGYHRTGQTLWFYLAALCLFGFFMYQVMCYLAIVDRLKGHKKSQAAESTPLIYKRYRLLMKLLPAHFDKLCLILLILSLFNRPEWFLIYFGLVYNGMWGGKFLYDFFFTYR